MTRLPGSEWRRLLLEAAVILLVGAALGLSLNFPRIMDLLGEGGELPAGPAASYPVPASLEEVQELLRGGALAVDARAVELYRNGHLPGAVSFPLGEVEGEMAAFRARVPLEKTLVVYCSGYGCPDSFDLAIRLLNEGYRHVRIYEGGLPQWRDAGLPLDREGE